MKGIESFGRWHTSLSVRLIMALSRCGPTWNSLTKTVDSQSQRCVLIKAEKAKAAQFISGYSITVQGLTHRVVNKNSSLSMTGHSSSYSLRREVSMSYKLISHDLKDRFLSICLKNVLRKSDFVYCLNENSMSWFSDCST